MDSIPGHVKEPKNIGVGGSVMASMLASSVVDHGFKSRQVKEPKNIGGGGSVMVSMLASSVVDRGFKSRSGQRTKLHRW